MRSVSIRDLHIHTSELVREAAGGTVIVIEKRGEPMAELHPLTEKKRPLFPDFKAIRARMPRMDVDSTDIVSEGRDR
jgi:prevent-host-death family protein